MSTVLLLMDFQNVIVARHADAEATLAAAMRALAAARDNAIPVVFVRVAFRDGLPEVSPNSAVFGGLKGTSESNLYLESSPTAQIVPQLAPREDEPIVVKRRIGAFASDLNVVLSGLGATELVLAGISTSGVVLTTLREAADRDFRLTVLRDACADAEPEVQRVLLEKVFPRQAAVTTVDAWIGSL